MKNEIYFWILAIIAIIGIALAIRFLYQPMISIRLSTNTGLIHAYPYQTIEVPITVFNNGNAAIKNMSIGIYVNNTFNMLYHITLPAGKELTILYNYTPAYPGTYTIQAVADPGRLYNIADRATAQTSTTAYVSPAENATPYSLLPAGNIVNQSVIKLDSGAYVFASYLNSTYGLKMGLTPNSRINSFLNAVLGYVIYYIREIASASAQYKNGSQAYAIWLQGYVSPNMTNTAAVITGMKSENITRNGISVTFVSLGGNTTLCSYYSRGWIKILGYMGNGTCLSELNTSKITSIRLASFYNKTMANATNIGNYSFVGKVGEISGDFALFANRTLMYATVSNSSVSKNSSNVCYGLINTFGNESYCSEYVFPVSTAHIVNGSSLIRTTAYINSYNASVYSLVNTSLIMDQVPINIQAIKGYGIKGGYLAFVSGIKSTCSFNSTFACSNVTWTNGTLGFRLRNLGSTARLNSVSCYMTPKAIPQTLNETIQSNSTIGINATCYESGAKMSGIALNLGLKLVLNYTLNNSTQQVNGTAYIPIG
ncbi:MAG: CARDB domain-containing protein [Candidatus Micrarchaeia archaeon]